MVAVVKYIQQKLKQLNKWWLSKLVKERSNLKEEKNETITRTRNENQEEPQTQTQTKVLETRPKRRGRKKKNDNWRRRHTDSA